MAGSHYDPFVPPTKGPSYNTRTLFLVKEKKRWERTVSMKQRAGDMQWSPKEQLCTLPLRRKRGFAEEGMFGGWVRNAKDLRKKKIADSKNVQRHRMGNGKKSSAHLGTWTGTGRQAIRDIAREVIGVDYEEVCLSKWIALIFHGRS